MNKYQVTSLLAEKLPEVHSDLTYLAVTGNVNKAMSVLVEYTKKLIVSQQFKNVYKCMALVNRIYIQGDAVVKNAVTNVYVYSFSVMSLCCNKVEWNVVQAKIPFNLYSIYLRQLMQAGC